MTKGSNGQDTEVCKAKIIINALVKIENYHGWQMMLSCTTLMVKNHAHVIAMTACLRSSTAAQ